jgi:DNA adenine methylase
MSKINTFADQVGPFERFCPPRQQLLKWIGNKQKFAATITGNFPLKFNKYFEPFLGSGAILATVAPINGTGSDTFKPLIEIWQTLKSDPEKLKSWYAERRKLITNQVTKEEVYKQVLQSYNSLPNGQDFVFLSRACYGGVIRFRKADGFMSTPCGAHTPIDATSFNNRVDMWHGRVKNSSFIHADYKEAFNLAKKGDLIYCDPPYSFSQSILYGAQTFSLGELLNEIEKAKAKGIFVALSIDGHKKSGNFLCDLPIPEKLFEREVFVDVGISMLRRFQMGGEALNEENVHDRLLLTY